MAQPRNRPNAVNSAYFEDVTPLWVPPDRDPIPELYHSASFALADWATSQLPSNSDKNWSDDESGFWPLRHFLLAAAERWRAYDWKADEESLATRKQDEKHRETIARATKAFRLAISKSAYRKAERDLGISVAAALCPKAEIDMTYVEGCDAVTNALLKFERSTLRPDSSPARFGPLLYAAPPRRLPRPEIAVALVLADFVTGFRCDEYRTGNVHFPRTPLLSPKLPWKAITLFATAYTDDPEAEFDHRKVASSVKNLKHKVAQIMRLP